MANLGAQPAMDPSARQVAPQARFRSIFTPSTREERNANFKSYLAHLEAQDGEILVEERDLAIRRARRARIQVNPVRARCPLPDPARFYRNALRLRDDPRLLDRRTLLATFLYKFAWHE